MRNSSLVEGSRADNVPGLKPAAEAVGSRGQRPEVRSQMEGPIRSYQDLEVYRKSYQLALEIHGMSLSFPEFERYELGRQLREASKSIPVNIAEGHGRRSSTADFKRFLVMAHSSCGEVKVWLKFCKDLGYISQEQGDELWEKYDEIGRMLNGLRERWK